MIPHLLLVIEFIIHKLPDQFIRINAGQVILLLLASALRPAARFFPARIADRNLNNTPRSIAAAKTYFMRPLREATRPVPMGSTEIAATIMPPEDGDIGITWQSKTHVVITVSARPYHCPKKITAYIGLDLSNSEE